MSDMFGIFDVQAVKKSCWQTCNNDPGGYPMDLSQIPFYRDTDTMSQFHDVALVFGCTDLCEKDYENQRLLFALPIAGAVIAAAAVISIFCICWFCKCCPCYKFRTRDKKSKLVSQTSTMDYPAKEKKPYAISSALNETRSTLASFFSARSIISTPDIADGKDEKPYFRNKALAKKRLDLSASMKSDVSVNSWMTDQRSRSRRDTLMETVTTLGKKLAMMDKRSEEQQRNGGNRRSPTVSPSGWKPRPVNKHDSSNRKKSKSVKEISAKNPNYNEDSPTGILNPPMRF